MHGWPASLISIGHDVLLSVRARLLVAFVSEAIKGVRPAQLHDRGRLHDGCGRGARSARSREPWQLYARQRACWRFGWAGTSLGMITNTLGLWFDKKRGMAISLALNGASFGGIVGVPLLVAAIGHFGFPGAMTAAGARDGRGDGSGDPDLRRTAAGSRERWRMSTPADAPSPTQIRAQAFRDIGFLSVSAAFALVLFAQVGFIVHLIAFLDSVIGRRTGGDRGGAVDRDGGGRPRAVLLRDRPAQPAAGVGALLCQPGGRRFSIIINVHQRRTR